MPFIPTVVHSAKKSTALAKIKGNEKLAIRGDYRKMRFYLPFLHKMPSLLYIVLVWLVNYRLTGLYRQLAESLAYVIRVSLILMAGIIIVITIIMSIDRISSYNNY